MAGYSFDSAIGRGWPLGRPMAEDNLTRPLAEDNLARPLPEAGPWAGQWPRVPWAGQRPGQAIGAYSTPFRFRLAAPEIGPVTKVINKINVHKCFLRTLFVLTPFFVYSESLDHFGFQTLPSIVKDAT